MDLIRTISSKGRNGDQDDDGASATNPETAATAVVDSNNTTTSVAAVEDNSNHNSASATATTAAPSAAPSSEAHAVEIPCESAMDDDFDEDEDYEYEEDDAAPFVSGFLVDNPQLALAAATTASTTEGQEGAMVAANAPAKIEEDEEQQPAVAATKWREPTREAVNMSLRAEQETTGGKRRLAQDLYRIMNQDTKEAGFSLNPTSEDSMDKWTINLFQFDSDSNLAKDMLVLGIDHVELEMTFPDQYPFEPPFVRVVRPRFKKQTGFVMNGALCMELLTKDGWNPINDIESVIVSIRSLLVVGDGRLEAAIKMTSKRYSALLASAMQSKQKSSAGHGGDDADASTKKRQRKNSAGDSIAVDAKDEKEDEKPSANVASSTSSGGSYSVAEAQSAYSHLSDYHKKKGWDTSGWWARKG